MEGQRREQGLTDSLRTRRVLRMNCSLSCLRRLLGIFSRGITNRSRGGTLSPISCISPSTIHHSDLSSAFFSGRGGDLWRRLEWEAASGRGERSWWEPRERKGVSVREWRRLARDSMDWISASKMLFFLRRRRRFRVQEESNRGKFLISFSDCIIWSLNILHLLHKKNKYAINLILFLPKL